MKVGGGETEYMCADEMEAGVTVHMKVDESKYQGSICKATCCAQERGRREPMQGGISGDKC